MTELEQANARADKAVMDAREANSLYDVARRMLRAARADFERIEATARLIAERGHVIPADVGWATVVMQSAADAGARIDKADGAAVSGGAGS